MTIHSGAGVKGFVDRIDHPGAMRRDGQEVGTSIIIS